MQRISDEVARRLVQQIRSGAFERHRRLPSERRLAQTFGVSLASLREAVRSLEAMGLVSVQHGRGVFLRQAQAGDGVWHRWMTWIVEHGPSLLDLLEVRAAIETKSADLAARHATPQHCARLEEILAQAERLVKTSAADSAALHAAYVQLDLEFHRAIAEAGGNAVLRQLVESLGSALRGSREATVALPGRIRRSIREHRRIAAAIRRRTPSAARQAMEAHVRRVIEEVRRLPALSGGGTTRGTGRGAARRGHR
ncbi:MAG: FCD domain-containing protein [Armatimonadota bacterium]|nr:FCD domain-containing protein [Armatimonadota bacterium]MDR7500094.1 FCD domain-containing protein [Armatimonadota bacterium]MDR7558507.1 FCD domain-containing protein [Armatimonadota bacterium]MDR7572083.1 FCD domain-containing protein [Armatimonadota bacterium]